MSFTRNLVSCILVGLCFAGCHQQDDTPSGMVPQNPSPMVDHIRNHQRIKPDSFRGMEFEVSDLLDQPIHVFIPDRKTDSGFQAVWFHFHGASFILQNAITNARESMIGVNIQLGSGSSAYEKPFFDEATFVNLLEVVFDKCQSYGVLTNPEPEIYLSSFSAGYGAIRRILSAHAAKIDGVVLLDGLHTDYIPDGRTLFEGGEIDKEKLQIFITFAGMALSHQKKMLITHSEIFPGTYASTTETADILIEALGLKRRAVLEWGPGGMQMIAETRSGSVAIWGFAGNSAPDHLDHLHGLPYFMNQVTEF